MGCVITNPINTPNNMVTTNTVVAKAAALATLPALTFGLFALPASAAVNTNINISSQNMALTTNAVESYAYSGDATVMTGSASVGGNGGDSSVDAGEVDANSDTDANSEATTKDAGGNEADVDTDSEATADDYTEAAGIAKSYGGNGGDAGTASTLTAISTGNAESDVAIMGAQNTTEIDVEVTPATPMYDEYYMSGSMSYDSENSGSEYDYDRETGSEYDDEYDEDDCGCEVEHNKEGSEWDNETKSGSEYEASKNLDAAYEEGSKVHVPVNTTVNIDEGSFSATTNVVLSDALSGGALVAGGSMSAGGNGGQSDTDTEGIGASSDTNVGSDATTNGAYGEDADVTTESDAHTSGETRAFGDASSAGGDAGAGSDSLTESLVATGHSLSRVSIVDASNHKVIRVRN